MDLKIYQHKEQLTIVMAEYLSIYPPQQAVTLTGIKVQCLLESSLGLLTLNYSRLRGFDLRFLRYIPIYYYKNQNHVIL